MAFYTLGCRLNFSESDTLKEDLAGRGIRPVAFGEPSDVTVINTCTVTDGADASCRNIIRRARKHSPQGKVVVVGCYAQMEAKRVGEMGGVDLVLGTSEKFRLGEYLEDLFLGESIDPKVDKTSEFFKASQGLNQSDRTRGFLKIQDGCNYICSFCIIPQARGRSRTIAPEEAIVEAKKMIAAGRKEIVLTGVNIGEYGATSSYPLERLLGDLLSINGLERLRLSSVEPNTITEELLKILAASKKGMDHFHVPLQSGSDLVLKKMRRKYSASQYCEILSMIRSFFPDATIGADMIVGHPGEGEAEFEETYALAKKEIDFFHVFPFSERQGTLSAKMEDKVSELTKKRRVRELISLGDRKIFERAQDNINKENAVLFESRNKEGFWLGHTTNFFKVWRKTDRDLDLTNKIVPLIPANFDPERKAFIC